jgi:hypothetical protein
MEQPGRDLRRCEICHAARWFLHYLADIGDDTDAISGVIKTFTAKRTRSVREALITTYA